MQSVLFRNLAWNGFDAFENAYKTASSHVEETKDSYLIQLDVPGFAREDLKISLEERHLVVEGERKGRTQAKIRKAFLLPDDVDLDKIEAQTKNGVLELALPKTAPVKPKAIEVREAGESYFKQIAETSKAE